MAVLFFTSHLLQAQQPAPFLGSAIAHQPDIKALRSQFQFGSGTRFIENKGQIADTKGNPRPDIKYYTEGTNGVRMYFSADKISYVFAQYDTATSSSLSSQQTLTLPLSQRERERTNGNSFSPLLRGTTGGPQVTKVESLYRMDMSLLGASPTEIQREEESQDRTNYYYPHCPNGVTNVHSYSTITYKNIYPNIDLVYRQNASGVKYDLIVNPGGNVSDIRLQYAGADNMSVTNDGKMQIVNPFGKVQEDIPYTYQMGADAPAMLDVFDSHKDGGMQTVSASYKIKDNVVTFAVGAYDRTRPLVIDPTLAWCTFYGGIGSENEASLGYIGEIISDGSGNIVITGTTNSVNFPVTIGAFQTTYGGAGISGQGDAYIVKFDGAGNRLWATYYGGSGDEEGTGITVDGGGNIFITGETRSLDFPTSTNAFQITLQGTANSYLVKLDSTGVRQWATYYGGNNEYGEQVTTDLSGNVIMIGSAYSGFPVTNGAFQTTFGGGLGDAFVVKFDGSGNRQWATYCGGNDVDNGYGIVTDKSGNIFITGSTASTNFPVTAGAFQTNLSSKVLGQDNAFIAKFSSVGKQLWTTYYGGSGDDIGFAIAIDSNENVFITGNTGSSDFPVTKGAYQTAYALQSDAFILKFDENGNRQWATYYGGRNLDVGYGIAIDADDNILISGRTTGNFPVTNDAFQSNLINCAFVLKFDNNGTKRLWATQFGSTDKTVLTFGNGITTDHSGNIFIIGETNDLSGH
ncbi:MAG TPA: SBBP repeat-containing protein, partial [Candidatus Kapabacteria bacterium]|nr:SBBP repeat-containing protein [Candidatus Kapabacteria bacterium]